jgi:hypothetical protein
VKRRSWRRGGSTAGLDGVGGLQGGWGSPRQRREADLFLADLMGEPLPPLPRPALRTTTVGSSPRPPEDPAPARIFDRIVHGGARPEEALGAGPGEIWEVVALPGSTAAPLELQAGDLTITRALGEARLAHLGVVGEEGGPGALYGAQGLIRPDTLVLRRHRPTPPPRHPEFPAFEQGPAGTTDLGDVTIGNARFPLRVPTTGDERRPDMEDALRAALSRAGQSFAIRGSLYQTGEVRLCAFTPAAALPTPAPPVIDCQGHARAANLCALVLASGGEALAYFPALRPSGLTPPRRWVIIPKLRDFFGLPADVQRAHRRRWIDVLARVTALGWTRAQLETLSTPALRLLLAQHEAGAFTVQRVDRGSPPTDRGGVVNGVTLPLPALPAVEPDCYLPVISEREGRLESINAWDAEAGISLGPIQFNVNPPEGANEQTLFRFLWRLSVDDRVLFDQAFGTLGWRMRFDPAGIVPGPNDELTLRINAGTPTEVTLSSLRTHKTRNYRYFQTGVPDQTGFNPAFRRDLATRFRQVVVWPHVQQMILDVSSQWLQPGLAHIRAAGIPAVDPLNPDADTFTLTAVLLSAYVRFSGCLRPLLTALRPWRTVADKLAHLQQALATLTDPCPSLDTRLRNQVNEARAVHAGLDSIRRQRQAARPGAARPGEAAELDPAEQTADAAPRAAAPHILDFRPTTILASDPLAFRTSLADKAAEMMGKLDDLGIRDDPPGRREAYVDAIAWNEPADLRRGLRACPSVDGQCILSSCALVVRSLWRLLGARDVFTDSRGQRLHLLDPPYRAGSAMVVLRRYAELSGALHTIASRADLDRANPQKGDAVFINRGNSQHVFTIVERSGDRFVSVDGGQSGRGDGGCCAIHRRERTLAAGAITFTGDDRPITAVAKLGRLRFTARLIDLDRRSPPSGRPPNT